MPLTANRSVVAHGSAEGVQYKCSPGLAWLLLRLVGRLESAWFIQLILAKSASRWVGGFCYSWLARLPYYQEICKFSSGLKPHVEARLDPWSLTCK